MNTKTATKPTTATVLVNGLEMPADCRRCGAELPVNDWDLDSAERGACYVNRCDNCGEKAVA